MILYCCDASEVSIMPKTIYFRTVACILNADLCPLTFEVYMLAILLEKGLDSCDVIFM